MNNCFSDGIIEPVRIIDVARGHEDNEKNIFPKSCMDLNHLEWALKPPNFQNLGVRFVSVCQRNSWRSLQITQPMFTSIVNHHGLNESAHELLSCFYTRNSDLEDTYCAPLSLVQSGDSVDTSYTLRYPEFKENENRWALRQSGIYHRFNQRTNQHLLLLLSPLPNSAGHTRIENFLLNRPQSVLDDPLWAHELIFSTYLPAWRRYIAWLEGKLIPITNLTAIADIDREMRVNYEKLNTLYVLINKLLQIPTLLSLSSDVLDDLSRHSVNTSDTPSVQQLENLRRKTAAYSRTASCLHQRAQATAQILSDTLSLRDQTLAKNQADNMAGLGKSTYWITIMGLLYLPATLVATIFGTNFFDFDEQRRRIVASTDIWYFFLASGILTLVTLAVCHYFREYGMTIPRQAFDAVKWKGLTECWGSIRKRDKKSSYGSPA